MCHDRLTVLIAVDPVEGDNVGEVERDPGWQITKVFTEEYVFPTPLKAVICQNHAPSVKVVNDQEVIFSVTLQMNVGTAELL